MLTVLSLLFLLFIVVNRAKISICPVLIMVFLVACRLVDGNVNIHHEEHEWESAASVKDILMVPTISDVSTIEEWRTVAEDMFNENERSNSMLAK